MKLHEFLSWHLYRGLWETLHCWLLYVAFGLDSRNSKYETNTSHKTEITGKEVLHELDLEVACIMLQSELEVRHNARMMHISVIFHLSKAILLLTYLE